MKLQLLRQNFGISSTTGEMFAIFNKGDRFSEYSGTEVPEKLWQGYTLEDEERMPDVKIPKYTCIPRGFYKISINFSNRFQRRMPIIYNFIENGELIVKIYDIVFKGIRVHIANDHEDVEGCIAIGDNITNTKDYILDSKIAFDRFYRRLLEFTEDGKNPIGLEILKA